MSTRAMTPRERRAEYIRQKAELKQAHEKTRVDSLHSQHSTESDGFLSPSKAESKSTHERIRTDSIQSHYELSTEDLYKHGPYHFKKSIEQERSQSLCLSEAVQRTPLQKPRSQSLFPSQSGLASRTPHDKERIGSIYMSDTSRRSSVRPLAESDELVWRCDGQSRWTRAVVEGESRYNQYGVGSRDRKSPEVYFTCKLKLEPAFMAEDPRADEHMHEICKEALQSLVDHRRSNGCDCDFEHFSNQPSAGRHDREVALSKALGRPLKLCKKGVFKGRFVRKSLQNHDEKCGCNGLISMSQGAGSGS